MEKSGFILINKPSGPTSHDIVDALRRITGVRKIGHAGTLDPFASGLLILGVGREATKKLSVFLKQDKEYTGKIKLGAVSTTYDRDGEIRLVQGAEAVMWSEIKNVLTKFVGSIEQVPPAFSAKKIKGKKLYELARTGIEVKLKPVSVIIYSIKLLNYDWPFLEIRVKCSSGTYIRSLAHDIGRSLGCGGYLEELCRTKIGKFSLNEAVEISRLNPRNWQEFLREY
jgi:tRNA pseudouridine55 synthase